jgi:hypothetical protein
MPLEKLHGFARRGLQRDDHFRIGRRLELRQRRRANWRQRQRRHSVNDAIELEGVLRFHEDSTEEKKKEACLSSSVTGG